jgi:hypothetical protein
MAISSPISSRPGETNERPDRGLKITWSAATAFTSGGTALSTPLSSES